MSRHEWCRDLSAEYPTQPPCKSIEEWPAGHIFIGTREALIATGRFRAEWFPGEPGMRRHTSTVTVGERRISIQKQSPRLFKGTVGYTPDEGAARDAGEKQSRKLTALREELATLPDCEKAYRGQILDAHLTYSAHLGSLCKGDERTGGYRLDDESQYALAQLMRRILEVLHRGEVKLDRTKRAQALERIYEAHGEDAPPDEAFAQFLAGLATPAGNLGESPQ